MASAAPASRSALRRGEVQVRTLGRFQVEVDGTPLKLGPKAKRKPLELLKVLIALGGEGASVATLTESLWPEAEGDRAYGSFSITLNRLRKLIGHEALQLQDGRLYLVPESCWVDSRVFSELLGRVVAALEAGDGTLAWDLLEEALTLYQGPFLEGEFEPPEILGARQRLHGLFLRHIDQMGGYLRQQGHHAKAAAVYQRALEIDDLAEELYQQLMRCLEHQGRNAEAIAVYQRCHQIFRATIGIDPSPETQALYQALLQRPTAPVGAVEEIPARQGESGSLSGTSGGAAAADQPPAPPAEGTLAPDEPVAESITGWGERRPATVATFVLSGHGALNAALDPEEVALILERWRGEATGIVEANGGVVNQVLGGEIVALFGIPQAHEEDPRLAINSALALHRWIRLLIPPMQERIGHTLRLKTGITTGLVVTQAPTVSGGRYGLAGAAVSTGMQLAQAAQPDEILVTQETLRVVEPFFQFESLPPRVLGEQREPVSLFRILGETAVRNRFELAEQRGFTPYTGRVDELAQLHECVARTGQGQGQLVTVLGEAGLGKSRLLFELRHGLDPQRHTVLLGRCQPQGGNTPYLPFLDALRRGLRLRDGDSPERMMEKIRRNVLAIDPSLERYLPYYLHLLSMRSDRYRLPPGLEGEELREGLEKAVMAMVTLNVRERPMVLVLEDWHWADEASDALLRKAMDVIANYHLMVVVSYRPDYRGSWGHMAHHTHLTLKPLDEGGTEQMVLGMLRAGSLPAGLAGMIHGHTGGNPFFIEEVCHSLREEGTVTVQDGQAVLNHALEQLTLPDTVQALVRTRIDRIEAGNREVLRLAAVIGERFDLRVLEQVYPHRQRLIRALVDLKGLEMIQQIQVYPEEVFRFNHTITRMVAYETLLREQRKLLHERVGLATEAMFADRLVEHFEALAYHFSNSAHAEKAAYYLERAGDKATRYFSLVEARRHYRDALELLQMLPERPGRREKRIDLSLKWGSVSFYNPSPALVKALEAAHSEAQAMGDAGRIARANFWMGMFHYALGTQAQALARFQEGLEMREVVDDPELHALTLNYMGRVYFYLAQFPEAKANLEQGIPLLQARGRSAEAANSTAILAMVYMAVGDFDKSYALIDEVFAIVKAIANPAIEGIGNVIAGLVNLAYGNWQGAYETSARAAEVSHRVGNLIMEGMGLWGQGYATVMLGEEERGNRLMHEGLGIIESTRSILGLSAFYGWTAVIYALRGRPEESRGFAEIALRFCEAGNRLGEPNALAALAMAAALEPSPDWKEAAALMERCLAASEEVGSPSVVAILYYQYATCLVGRGEKARAAPYLKRAMAMFTRMKMNYWQSEARRLQGARTRKKGST